MTSKVKIHSYMKYNKISILFEELMGKLIEELPTNPIEYLIKVLQNKSLELGTKELGEKSSTTNKLWSTQKQAEDQIKQAGRQYQKPWLSNSKKQKNKHSLLNKTAPSVINESSNVSIKSTEDATPPKDEESVETTAKVPKLYGERKKIIVDEEELKCTESEKEVEASGVYTKQISAQKAKKLRFQAMKKKLVEENEKEYEDDGASNSGSEDDDATELCEDYDELKNEGVMRPPKSGIHIRRREKQRKEQIELVFNISKFFDNLGGTLETPRGSSIQFHNEVVDDDDFESASQVTGPRKPVWETAPSEAETVESQQFGKMTSRNMQSTTMFDQNSITSKASIKTNKSKEKSTTGTSQISPGKLSGIKAQDRLGTKQNDKQKDDKKTRSLVDMDLQGKPPVAKEKRRSSASLSSMKTRPETKKL